MIAPPRGGIDEVEGTILICMYCHEPCTSTDGRDSDCCSEPAWLFDIEDLEDE